jgi:hypothetical protein
MKRHKQIAGQDFLTDSQPGIDLSLPRGDLYALTIF